jgi:N-glycosylase/DNA lyase
MVEALRDMPYDEAHRHLTALPGVGDKVADCVLLFGCEHASAFPVDVWVERLMREWFGVSCASRTAVCRQARALLGEHAGLMQQFLFHAARTEGV